MSLLFVWHKVKRSMLPHSTDLSQTILNGKFFRCSTRNVFDLLRVLVKTPVDDALKGEVLGLVVEVSTSLRLTDKQSASATAKTFSSYQ